MGDPPDGRRAPLPKAGRDAFAHGPVPVRPTYDPDEPDNDRSEAWPVVKGLLAVVLLVSVFGGLFWLVAGGPR
jgi:hypothetical protein